MPVNKKMSQYVYDHVGLCGKIAYHEYEDIHCYMTKRYREEEQRIRDFTVCEDDVWVLTYPKCGKYVFFFCRNIYIVFDLGIFFIRLIDSHS